jgi:hypothetical protein
MNALSRSLARRCSIVALCVAVLTIPILSSGCASAGTVPRDVQIKHDVALAIDALGAFAKGVEALADATPPVLTREQAFTVLDIDRAAVVVLRSANLGAYSVLKEVLTQVGQLPFAAKIQKYIDLAKITLAALTPAPVASLPEVFDVRG